MQNTTFDRIDLKMSRFLQENGRASNLELAEAINLSASQCHRRVCLDQIKISGAFPLP